MNGEPENRVSSKSADHAESLLAEISELRDVVRMLSQQLLRIERRIRVALPKSETHGKAPRRTQQSPAELIQALTEDAKAGADIEKHLRRMTMKHELATLARQLGMTNTQLPPKDRLVPRIAARGACAVERILATSASGENPNQSTFDSGETPVTPSGALQG